MTEPSREDRDDVTLWFKSLQDGDEQAVTRLFEHCFPRLLRYARTRLPEHLRRVLDEEDVALSAFKSLCTGAQRGALDEISNRQELWKLLTCITARKGMAYVRHETRQKRGGGKVRGESLFLQHPQDSENARDTPPGIQQVDGRELSPAVLAELEDEYQRLLESLQDANLQAIALLRLEGYSVDEIAERIGCAKRSVERRLRIIRKIWTDSDAQNPPQDAAS